LGGWDPTHPRDPSTTPTATIVRPVKVYLQAGVEPEPLELHEAPTVRVEVRFQNSQGEPYPGGPVTLKGEVPDDEEKAESSGSCLPTTSGLASRIGGPEPRYTGHRIHWTIQMVPDADGRVVLRAPKGLREASLETRVPDETISLKTRLGEGKPLGVSYRLDDLDADVRGVTFVCYKAPTVLVTVQTEGGEPPPDDTAVFVGYNVKGGDYGGSLVRQADGRYRNRRLVPDFEYEFTAWSKKGGYVPKRVERVSLPEGASTELTLILRKKPTPPQIGDPAPAFSVPAIDGRMLDLETLRGKFVLLHVWIPFFDLDRDLLRHQAIRDRFGADRLAIIGLCLSADLKAASDAIESLELTWPQAILRDRGAAPIIQAYDGWSPPKSFLIGPDGTILARDLSGDQVEGVVAEALGRNPTSPGSGGFAEKCPTSSSS
jgi:peroxiredoxin